MLGAEGVDVIDCSSGMGSPKAQMPSEPEFQVPFAEAIKKSCNVFTAAVGLITEARQANAIIESGRADIVFLAREHLRDAYWVVNAAGELGCPERAKLPVAYDHWL